jgi:alkanesulfonate monooxygenase SsuD/methylene tetrahydromethanopterin reductase-like flavin-dependent oxidoreductase (luciferase family)
VIELYASYTALGGEEPVAWARGREDEGWDGVGVADHLWHEGMSFPHVWVSAGAIAAATTRLRIASSFANNLLRSPVEFAQAALTLHRVSGGRFEAGLGAGWLAEEMTGIGEAFPGPGDRVSRYREALLVVRELFAARACRYDGDHYRVDVPALCADVEGAPELVGSVGGPRAIREITPLVDRIEVNASSRASRGGRMDFRVLGTIGRAEVADMVAAVRAVRPDVPVGLFVVAASGDHPQVARLGGVVGGDMFGGLFGDPARVVDGLLALEDLGVSRVHVNEFAPGTLDALGSRLAAARG